MSSNFQLFFSTALGNTFTPYAYQQALAEQNWPDILIAPTGLGKTASVVLGWAWQHASADHNNPATPLRRLVYCLPMRTLVEQTADNVRKWLERLREADPDWKSNLPDPGKDVHILMGGVDKTPWYKNPERTAILIGTQDMLLSRALMRGYAMSRFRWPVDFALLHNDTQWVFDEVQLMRSGLATSTQLEGFRRKFSTELPARSLWTSATLHPEWLKTVDFPEHSKIWKVPKDFPEDKSSSRVRKLTDAPKLIKKSNITLNSDKKDNLKAYAEELASEAVSIHKENHLTLLVVNTVARAQAVHSAIKKKGFSSDRLALIHSRFRPADQKTQMDKLPRPGEQKDLIVIATQAIEAGVDFSAAVMLTELASTSSFVQRLGRLNRYGELNDRGGGNVRWIDILSNDPKNSKNSETLCTPYTPQEIEICRERIATLSNACSSKLPSPEPDDSASQSVIRSKDLVDLYDTDPDLTGFYVDISSYVRDSEDTDIRVFWRDLSDGYHGQSMPIREELCAVPIGRCANWLKSKKIKAFFLDPQARSNKEHWIVFSEPPWSGLLLMLDKETGGYTAEAGFIPDSKTAVEPVHLEQERKAISGEANDTDNDSESKCFVKLSDHLTHVTTEVISLCGTLGISSDQRKLLCTAAHWHDVGKAHQMFQERMSTNDEESRPRPEYQLAKAPYYDRGKGRPYFRHELASALAYLSQSDWSREADLVAYLIAAHHGKVRMNLRALPVEEPRKARRNGETASPRFARGIWEGDNVPPVEMNGETLWDGGELTLSVMELGEHPATGSSWMERTSCLLSKYGPFRLAWFEALLRIADWRASEKEEKNSDDG